MACPKGKERKTEDAIKFTRAAQELETARQRIQRLEAIIDASKKINSTLELEQLLDLILQTAVANTCAEAGTIYLADHEKQEIWSEVSRGSDKIHIRLPFGQGIAGYVAQSGDTVQLNDAYSDPRFINKVDRTTGFKTTSMLCMPMWNETKTIIGVFQLLNKKTGTFCDEDKEFLSALSIHAAIAVERAQAFLELKEKKDIEDELAIASKIQNRLLPLHLPKLEGYEFAVRHVASEWVSGDYYDTVPLSGSKVAFIIADVCGKGIPASLLMATLRAALHAQTLSHGMSSPSLLISRLNRLIYNSTPASSFITAFYGELDCGNGLVRYVNAGHLPPIHILNSGQRNLLQVGGLTLGLVEDTDYVVGQIAIGSDESLVLYTDGITEAMNSENEEFGEERLEKLVIENKNASPDSLIQTIENSIEIFTSGEPQHDDMTLLVLQRK